MFLGHIGDSLYFLLGAGPAVDQQSKNTVSKTSASASGDSKVDSGMTDWITSCLTGHCNAVIQPSVLNLSSVVNV